MNPFPPEEVAGLAKEAGARNPLAEPPDDPVPKGDEEPPESGEARL
jgi:hypothetical protein